MIGMEDENYGGASAPAALHVRWTSLPEEKDETETTVLWILNERHFLVLLGSVSSRSVGLLHHRERAACPSGTRFERNLEKRPQRSVF